VHPQSAKIIHVLISLSNTAAFGRQFKETEHKMICVSVGDFILECEMSSSVIKFYLFEVSLHSVMNEGRFILRCSCVCPP
jgi:hypothetical protein